MFAGLQSGCMLSTTVRDRVLECVSITHTVCAADLPLLASFERFRLTIGVNTHLLFLKLQVSVLQILLSS